MPVLFAMGCASGGGALRSGYDVNRLDRVAVVDVTGYIGGEAAKNQIANLVVAELLAKGYTPVERMRVKQVLKEQEFQASDVTNPHDAVQAGRVLNVSALLTLNVAEFGEKINMTATLVDAEDAGVVWSGWGTGSTGRTLATVAGAAVGVAAGATIGGSSSARVVGGLAGGVLGGVAGYTLSPGEVKQARKVIHEMFESLPSKPPAKSGDP